MSNYPPGVTGMEYEISGPSAEYTQTRDVECDRCDEDVHGEPFSGTVEGDVVQWGFDTRLFFWKCPTCGHEHEDEDSPDYDGD